MYLSTKPAPSLPSTPGFWKAAQTCIVIATFSLIGGLFLSPKASLSLLWNVLIPLLPATFLITPILWRSLCPLASLNMLSNGSLSHRSLTAQSLPAVGTAGIVLLVVMVPARRFVFNESGFVLAVVILLIAIAALALGAVFDAKAGFCNAICPVLPVEKLYGQHPLWELQNPRCAPCTLCTAKGCIDLAPKKSIIRAIGTSTHSHDWLKTAYGVFAAAFPGFIIGYFTISDASIVSAGSIYIHIAMWAGASYLATTSLVLLLNIRSAYTLPLLAATAVGVYYWFAAPLILSVFELADVSIIILRSAIFAFVGFWLGRALFRVRLSQT